MALDFTGKLAVPVADESGVCAWLIIDNLGNCPGETKACEYRGKRRARCHETLDEVGPGMSKGWPFVSFYCASAKCFVFLCALCDLSG